MGVVYKLKDDVVAFIVDQKRENPTIGVRQLAARTSEKFQINVSKSSVSAILKNESLSSSVGRRSGDGARITKFSIPTTKKKEIAENLNQFEMVRREDGTQKPAVQATEKAGFNQNIRATKPVARETSKEDTLNAKGSLPVAPIRAENIKQDESQAVMIGKPVNARGFSEEVAKLRAQMRGSQEKIDHGLGYVFLKAAQWETSSSSLLEQLINQYRRGPENENFAVASEMFLYLVFLGVDRYEGIAAFERHGLWYLNGCQNAPVKGAVERILKELYDWFGTADKDVLHNAVLEYDLAMMQAFLDIKAYKLTIEDGSELFIDAGMTTFGMSLSSVEGLSAPVSLNKALTGLSNYLICNINPVEFCFVPGEKKFNQTLYTLLTVLENTPGKSIIKAGVIGPDNGVVAEFTTIPVQKRKYFIGVFPRQSEFIPLTKSVKWAAKKPYYHEPTDRIFYYADTRSDSIGEACHGAVGEQRVVTVWKEEDSSPVVAILTNQHQGVAEEILRAYFSRWPYLDAQEHERISILPYSEPVKYKQVSGPVTFADLIQKYISSLKEYSHSNFFPQRISRTDINDFIQTVYNSPGYFRRTGAYIQITLLVQSSPEYKKYLMYVAQLINERNIKDFSGRKLWVNFG